MTEEDSREQGIELGDLAEKLENEEYPMSKEELLDAHGDAEVGLEDDTQTLSEILGPMGETTFESAEEAKQSIIGMVGDEAIGRKNYSDRGGPSEAEAEGGRDESV